MHWREMNIGQAEDFVGLSWSGFTDASVFVQAESMPKILRLNQVADTEDAHYPLKIWVQLGKTTVSWAGGKTATGVAE